MASDDLEKRFLLNWISILVSTGIIKDLISYIALVFFV